MRLANPHPSWSEPAIRRCHDPRPFVIHSFHAGGPPAVLSVRPKVAELLFQVYGRALHPELFEVYATRTVRRGDYEATINITSAGHVVAWRYQGITLTEVAASAQHPLPQRRRLMSYLLKGERQDRVECRGGVRYQMNFQLEGVEPQVFGPFSRSWPWMANTRACCTASTLAGEWRWAR